MDWYPGKIIGDVFKGKGNPRRELIPSYKLKELERTGYKFLFDLAHGVLDGIAYPDDRDVKEYYIKPIERLTWDLFPELNPVLERYRPLERIENPRTALETMVQDIYSEIATSADEHGYRNIWALTMFLKFVIGRIYLLFPEDMYMNAIARLRHERLITDEDYWRLERLGKIARYSPESPQLRREVFEKEGPEAGIRYHLGSSDYHMYLGVLRANLNYVSFSIRIR